MTDDRSITDREDPDDRFLRSVLGPQLVARLYGVLRAVRIYDLSNQAVQDQLHEAVALLEDAMDEQVTMVAMGQCFYLNGVRVRAEPSQIPVFSALSAEFELRRLGGIRFFAGVQGEELGGFMRLMVEHADPQRGAQLAGAATGAGIVHVVPITLEELENAQHELDETQEDAEDTQGRARRSYRQALRAAKAAIVKTARSGRPAIRRAKRMVQPIVDSAIRNDFSIVGLTAIKSHDEYTYAHCVNVSILSIAIGQALGFPRNALANLGIAALLHDIGKTTIPVEVLSKSGRLTDQEWELMRRHPLEGMKMASRMPALSSLALDVLGVCLYHHLRQDGSGYPKVVRTGSPPPMARVVAVADCYDAMTAHRAYRARPFTGYEVLSIFLGQDRHLFDPAVLWGLVQAVGLYPAGTLMETRSGHRVLSLNNDREDLRRPHCRVLAYPDGRQGLESPPEIWAPMPRHESVARVVPPEEFEVEIDQLLAA